MRILEIKSSQEISLGLVASFSFAFEELPISFKAVGGEPVNSGTRMTSHRYGFMADIDRIASFTC